MALLTELEAEQVAASIKKVEQGTDAELVVVLARRADSYSYIPTLWAALAALVSPGFAMIVPLWLELMDILLVQGAVFVFVVLILRIPVVLRRIIPSNVKRWRSENLARRAFLENNLHRTKDQTGVLLFVSETERYVEIIADRGINDRVEMEAWQSIVDSLTAAIRSGNHLDGFRTAVEACGELLRAHVPSTGSKNELPNHLVLLD